MSNWEDYLENQIQQSSIEQPVREYRFYPSRRFRFDFCWPILQFAVEVDGNIFARGRHTSGAGYTKDCEKFALATIEGYRVMRVTTGQVGNGQAIEWIKQYFDKQVNKNEEV